MVEVEKLRRRGVGKVRSKVNWERKGKVKGTRIEESRSGALQEKSFDTIKELASAIDG